MRRSFERLDIFFVIIYLFIYPSIYNFHIEFHVFIHFFYTCASFSYALTSKYLSNVEMMTIY